MSAWRLWYNDPTIVQLLLLTLTPALLWTDTGGDCLQGALCRDQADMACSQLCWQQCKSQ